MGNFFNFVQILPLSLTLHEFSEDTHDAINANHANGTLTAGNLPGFAKIGISQGRDIRIFRPQNHTVPSHETTKRKVIKPCRI